jgi:hypothetical protein
MRKYQPLRDYLMARGGEPLAISFDELERVTGISLPYAARHHRQWWANGTNAHTQASAWMAAGYKVTDLDLGAATVRFVPDSRVRYAAYEESFVRKKRYLRRKTGS